MLSQATLAALMTVTSPDEKNTLTVARNGPITDSVGTDYVLETRRVSAKDTLRIACAPGGGFLVRITPLNP